MGKGHALVSELNHVVLLSKSWQEAAEAAQSQVLDASRREKVSVIHNHAIWVMGIR